MKIYWKQINEFNELQREMLTAFEDAFDKSNTGYEVVHLTDTSVHIRMRGWLSPYNVYNFIKNYPGIYIEIHPRAQDYLETRLFCNEWIREHELPRMMRRANRDIHCRNKETGVRTMLDK